MSGKYFFPPGKYDQKKYMTNIRKIVNIFCEYLLTNDVTFINVNVKITSFKFYLVAV